jgi:glycosyltransferase involved in cell wall biosynthesis
MSKMNQPKIINIMPHGPCYHFSPDEKPDYWWEKQDGSWLGFWTREWPDLLGEAVLSVTDQYGWEVWQPDSRADKIYTKQLDSGLIHRLFPAKEYVYRPGVKPQRGIYSERIISYLKELRDMPVILQLHDHFRVPFNNEILKIFGHKKKFPIFLVGYGPSKAPISEVSGLHRLETYLCLMVEQWRLKKPLKYIDVISEHTESALREVQKIYGGRVEKLSMGCDLDIWVPVPSAGMKKTVRCEINIPMEKKVFFASGNYVPRKQLDKLLEAFCSIINRNDFFLVIAGHGDKANTDLITSLAAPLVKQNKCILHPYVTGEELRNLYWASDVYISTANNEGGPVSVVKAMSCGLSVVTTPVGGTSELMKENNVGAFLPVKGYNEWAAIIERLLDNGLPRPLDIQHVRNAYQWENIARRFVGIYDDLCKMYF